MWLDLAIAFSCGGVGLVCGWIMHAIGGFGNQSLVRHAAASISQAECPAELPAELHPARVSEIAERIKQYAQSMAANVDAHQTTVQAVNDSLSETHESSPESLPLAIQQLLEANQTMQRQLQQAQSQIHQQSVQLESAERRAETDSLTQVPNRRAFDSHIAKQHALGSGVAGCLALIDVDHFKKFNDVYGHRAGDEVLRVVADVLHARLSYGGLVARFGGEEFAIILDGCPIHKAKDLIEAARIAIGQREILFEDKRLRVTASAGVAELMSGETIEDWLQRADDGMYCSKQQGRNCSHWMDANSPVRIGQDTADDHGGRAHLAAAETTPQEHRQGTPDGSQSPQPAQPAQRVALASLPDLETLTAEFTGVRRRTQASISIFLMAIRYSEISRDAALRSLLQIVRATMRSVDRIGCGEDSTLLISMPSMDESTARERGQMIYRSASAIGLGADASGCPSIRIGVAEVGCDEDFADAVSRTIELTRQQPEDGAMPVWVAGQTALAS